MTTHQGSSCPLPLSAQFPQVTFGTSGVRALVSDLTTEAISAYTFAFIDHLFANSHLQTGVPILLGIDLRPSSTFIASVICEAAQDAGIDIEFTGAVPTPALALRCLQTKRPGIMVTGSHIPFDRNGIKFYLATGEILKEDETAIAKTCIERGRLFNADDRKDLPKINPTTHKNYLEHYVGYFGSTALQGMRVGLFEHSAVGRDLTCAILKSLGAEVIQLGRSDSFVPIDTEAVRQEDLIQARNWCMTYALDALVSTDGDGDRPLVFDESGEFVRGDILGILCARELGLRALAVPVSCNTMIESSDYFARVLRTRIGSPFVIEGMRTLAAEGYDGIAGFEANGGFLLGSPLPNLDALPTRDAVLPMVAVLAAAARARCLVSTLVGALPRRFTHSDRIKDVPALASSTLLTRLIENANTREAFFEKEGQISNIDTTDGLRVSFAGGQIVHLRASGNAPELRCYVEADTKTHAEFLVRYYLESASQAISSL